MMTNASSVPSTAQLSSECVILLHGLARRKQSMQRIAATLKKHGYTVYNLGYPSTKMRIEEIAADYLQPLIVKLQQQYKVIHFVTHSMGAIVVRYYLRDKQIEQLGRVVMLAPPNQGSEWVDRLRNFTLFQWFFGPAGQELATDSAALPNRLGPGSHHVAIIAGDCCLNPLAYLLFTCPNDGTVAVERTKLAGVPDFIVIRASHSFIMYNRQAIKLILGFLQGFSWQPKEAGGAG